MFENDQMEFMDGDTDDITPFQIEPDVEQTDPMEEYNNLLSQHGLDMPDPIGASAQVDASPAALSIFEADDSPVNDQPNPSILQGLQAYSQEQPAPPFPEDDLGLDEGLDLGGILGPENDASPQVLDEALGQLGLE